MSNRTVLVDNNTWNNTHIATVGRALASTEEESIKIARQLDANYVLVIFGGMSNYSGDDISKFLWMVRIAAGVFPQIKEQNYYNKGHYRVDKDASETMRNSLMYRLCYYRFGEVHTSHKEPAGYDSVRKCEIGLKKWDLKYYREAYSSSRWLVRIFEVLPHTNRDAKMEGRKARALATTASTSGKDKVMKKDLNEVEERIQAYAKKNNEAEHKDGTTKGEFGIMGKRPTI